MSEKIKISVIIPTYNRHQLLVNVITSLKGQDFSDYEVIVVDNGCSDDAKIAVEKEMKDVNAEKYTLKYIQEPHIGLHNARHAGAKAARGDILIYLDDDLIADKNYLGEIYKVFQEIPDAGWVGGKILPIWEVEPPEWVKYFPPWYLSLYDEGNELKEVQWIYGSIRRDLLFRLGGFNPDAFGDKKMWWCRGDGEIGLLRKVHATGGKVIYNPAAVVWHYIPKERLTVEYFRERAFKNGIEASFSKHRYSNSPLNPVSLILYAGVFGINFLFHSGLAFIPSQSSIKHKVAASYHKGRFFYELKLAFSDDLRKLVKKENWL